MNSIRVVNGMVERILFREFEGGIRIRQKEKARHRRVFSSFPAPVPLYFERVALKL